MKELNHNLFCKMVTLTTIKDTRVRIRASEELKQVFLINQEKLQELPRRLAKELEDAGFKVHSNVQLIELNQENSMKDKSTHFNIKKLREVLKKTQWQENPSDLLKTSKKGSKKQELNTELKNEKSKSGIDTEIYLYLDELRWLKNFLDQLRQDEDNVQQSFYLNDLLENCQLELPKNGFLERNPELEARCQQLRMQEQNREYLRMTKNVDAVHKHYPEDTFGYQSKCKENNVFNILY